MIRLVVMLVICCTFLAKTADPVVGSGGITTDIHKISTDISVTIIPMSSLDIFFGPKVKPSTDVSLDKPVDSKVKKQSNNNVKAKKSSPFSAFGPGKRYVYSVTDAEKLMVAKLVYVEARGESLRGQVAVASVVFNRWSSGNYGSTIAHVISQPGAFAPISKVSNTQASQCMNAVELALKGYDPTREVFANGARYFYAPHAIGKKAANDRYGIKIMRIGKHAFHENFEKIYSTKKTVRKSKARRK